MAEIDVVEKVIAMDDDEGYDRIPYAGTQNPGIAQFDPDDFAVDADGLVHSLQKAGAIQYIGQPINTRDNEITWQLSKIVKPIEKVLAGDIILCLVTGDDRNGNLYQITRVDGTLIVTNAEPIGNIEGPQGIQGIRGPKGDKGDIGPQGASGPRGEQGEPGATPYIGSDGNWYIDGENTGVQAQGPQGIQGPKGDTGPAGPAFVIAGTVANEGQLPAPSTLADNIAYLVGNDTDGYDLYVQLQDTQTWQNVGKVEAVEGPQGPQGVSVQNVTFSYVGEVPTRYQVNTTLSNGTTINSGTITIPDATIPVANSTTLGGVMPVNKTSSMTQEVGVDSTGKLYTAPGGGGGTGGDGIENNEVIVQYDTLPTATADSPDFVQTPDGTLYRKSKRESAAGAYTWNDTPASPTAAIHASIDFTYQGAAQTSMSIGSTGGIVSIAYYPAAFLYTSATGWGSLSKDFTIQSNEIPADLAEYLSANATRQGAATILYSYEVVGGADITFATNEEIDALFTETQAPTVETSPNSAGGTTYNITL